jgi:DNA-binding transcriptional ArsR family regulator
MDEDKIILDKKSFGALAVDSRVNILKALKERRKTLSELSDELGLSVSSTKEHLGKLVDAELIIKVEDGHKWKYYELTRKGEKLVSPDQTVRVMVLLGISLIAFVWSFMVMGPATQMVSDSGQVTYAPSSEQLDFNESGSALKATGSRNITTAMQPINNTENSIIPLVIFSTSGIIILGSVIWLIRNKCKS